MLGIFDKKNNISIIAGEPKKAIMFLFWPMLLTYVVVSVNTYLDSFWASKLGVDAASAVNSMGDLYACIAAVGAGMGVACAASISYHLGEKNQDMANSVANHSIIVCMILSVILGIVIFLLTDPLVDMVGIQELRGYCHDFIMPIICCNLLFLINGALCGILRAEGASSKTIVATFLILSSAVFNPLFMIVLDMGVAGAAWGTVAATFLSTLYLTCLFLTKRTVVQIDFRGFKIEPQALKELFRISVPYGLQTSLRKIGNMVDRAIIVIVLSASMGSAAIAVYSLPWTYIRLVECLGLAFGAALIPVLSYNIGRKTLENGYAGIQYTLKAALISSSVITAIMFVLAGPLIAILATDPSFDEYQAIMTQFLMIAVLAGPMYAFRDVCFNTLQTLKRNNLCVVLAFGQLFLKMALMYVGGTMFGPLMMVVGDVLSHYVGAAVAYLCYRHFWNRLKADDTKVAESHSKIVNIIERIR